MALKLPIRDVLAATPRARVVRLDLNGHRFSYDAGQAVLVGLPGATRKRAYSIAGSPEDVRRTGSLELLIALDSSGASWLPLDRGTVVEIEGPVGRFTFPDDLRERRITFIAGGTGIAPLWAMLRQALHDPDCQIAVLYSARTPEEFAYNDELCALAREGRIQLRQTVTRATGECVWPGRQGRIGEADLRSIAEDPYSLCFICGPRGLVDDATRLLSQLGAPRERIRIEEW
jgi:ferredoxin-NADP reductase